MFNTIENYALLEQAIEVLAQAERIETIQIILQQHEVFLQTEYPEEMVHGRQIEQHFTQKGIYAPALNPNMAHLFRQARINRTDSFLDLGSGSGELSIAVELLHDCKTKGIEYSSYLHEMACGFQQWLAKKGKATRTIFQEGDFLTENFSPHTVFYYFKQGTHLERKLEQKLCDEAPSGSKIIMYGAGTDFTQLRKKSRTAFESTTDPHHPRTIQHYTIYTV